MSFKAALSLKANKRQGKDSEYCLTVQIFLKKLEKIKSCRQYTCGQFGIMSFVLAFFVAVRACSSLGTNKLSEPPSDSENILMRY